MSKVKSETHSIKTEQQKTDSHKSQKAKKRDITSKQKKTDITVKQQRTDITPNQKKDITAKQQKTRT